MKRIIYIGGFELPNHNASAFRAINNTKILNKIGYEVTLIGIDKKIKIKESKRIIIDDNSKIDITNFPYPNNLFGWFKMFTAFPDYIKIIKSYKDVKFVICYNFNSYIFIPILVYCRLNNIKIINETTEWYSTKGMFFVNKLIKFIDVQLRIKVIPKFVDGNIYATNFLVRKYSTKPFLVIPELIERGSIFRKNQSFQSIKNPRTIRILYNGNPGKTKDRLDKCIEILSEINSDFFFTIAGVSENEFLKIWPNANYKLDKIRDKVEFLGKVNHEKSVSLLKQSDYLFFFRDNNILTSVGFPRKIAEAALHGVPAITTKTSDLLLYFKDNYDITFIDFEISSAISKLKNVLESGVALSFSLRKNLLANSSLELGNLTQKFISFLDLL